MLYNQGALRMSQSANTQNESEKKGEKEEFEDEDELLMAMTPQEKAAWEKMMKSRIESMKKNHAEFQKWQDNMSRRRMFVYSRIRKLYAAQKDRLRFVLKMAETVKTARDTNNNNNNDNKDNNNNDSSDSGNDTRNNVTTTNGLDEADTDSPNSPPEKNTNSDVISSGVNAERQEREISDDSALPTIVEEKVMD